MRALLLIVSGSFLLLASGCGDVTPPSRPPLAPPGIDIPRAEKPATPPGAPAPGQTATPAPSPTPPSTPGAAQPAPQPGPPAPAMQRKVADVGAGKKGHYGGPGIITTPLATYFRASEMTVFKIQIPEAMNLYKAMNDNRAPATQDEFMQKIIKENKIKLPELPYGHHYVYDPKTEQLMIEKPANE